MTKNVIFLSKGQTKSVSYGIHARLSLQEGVKEVVIGWKIREIQGDKRKNTSAGI